MSAKDYRSLDNKLSKQSKRYLGILLCCCWVLAVACGRQEGTLSMENVCSNTPCENAGICSVHTSQNVDGSVAYVHQCLCPLEYAGDNCEIDLCKQLTCMHGSCEVSFNQPAGGLVAACQCAAGYMGVNCNIPCLTADCGRAGATCKNNTDCDIYNGYYCLPDVETNNLVCSLKQGLGSLCNDDQDCLSGSCTVNDARALKEQAGICDCDKAHYGEQCEYERTACTQYGGVVQLVNNTAFAGYCDCAADYLGPTCQLNIISELTKQLQVDNVSIAQKSLYTYENKLYATSAYLVRFPSSLAPLLKNYQIALFKAPEANTALARCTNAENLTDVVWDTYPNSQTNYLLTENAANEALFYLRLRTPKNRLTSCLALTNPVWYIVNSCQAATDTFMAKATFPASSFNESLTLGGIKGSCSAGYASNNNVPQAFCDPQGRWIKLPTSGNCTSQDCGTPPNLPAHATYLSTNTYYTGQAVSAVCVNGYSSSITNPLNGSIKCELNNLGGVSWQGSILGACLGNNGTACTVNNECQGVCIGKQCASLSPLNGPCDEDADCSTSVTGLPLKCSPHTSTTLGVCGGGGAGCSDNNQCNESAGLYCIPDLPLGGTKSCKARNGYCDGDPDCLNAKCIFTINNLLGNCQAVGFPCKVNGDCLNNDVCVPNGANSHVCLPARMGGTCDDDTDCPTSPTTIHCGNGYCGGNGALCLNNNACDRAVINEQGISYTCAPTGAEATSSHACRALSLTSNAYCDQADGNSDCALGMVCAPNNILGKNHLCVTPQVGGNCEDNTDCPVTVYAGNSSLVQCSQGLCGGSGAVCADNQQCASNQGLSCIPGAANGQTCSSKSAIGGKCNLDADCLANNCSVNNDQAVASAAGTCGGTGAACTDNVYCDASQSLICKPTATGLKCLNESPIGGACNDSLDCHPVYAPLRYTIECNINMPTMNSAGVCGGLNAACGLSNHIFVPAAEANIQCSQGYTCINGWCKDKTGLVEAPCDDDGDCGVTLACSTSGSLGVCGGSGAVCQANSGCSSSYTCIGKLCKDKSRVLGGVCDDDQDCLGSFKCSVNGGTVLGSCGGSGAICSSNTNCDASQSLSCLPGNANLLCLPRALVGDNCNDDQDCANLASTNYQVSCSTSSLANVKGICGGSGAVCQINAGCNSPYTCIGNVCKHKVSMTGGICDDDNDCLNNLYCSTSGSLGTCGGSGAVCQTNNACSSSYTCISSICKEKGSVPGDACDDNDDCINNLKCSTSGSLGACGGSGAVCQTNNACSSSYTCISSICKEKVSVPGDACDDNDDCTNNLKCSTSGSLGACGGSGAVCQVNVECADPYTCIGQLCKEKATVSTGNCDDDQDCQNGASCTVTDGPVLGTCGGSGAICLHNTGCNSGGGLYCIPNSNGIGRVCRLPVGPGGNCNDLDDCQYHNCTLTDDLGYRGICGGKDSNCGSDGDNSACVAGTVCAPSGSTHICLTPTTGSTCDDNLDCQSISGNYSCLLPLGVSTKVCSRQCLASERPSSLPAKAIYADNSLTAYAPLAVASASCLNNNYENHLVGTLTCQLDGTWSGSIGGTCLAKVGVSCVNNSDCAGYTEGIASCINQQCTLKNANLTSGPCDVGDASDCATTESCVARAGKSLCLRSSGSNCSSNSDCISGYCTGGICKLAYVNEGIIAAGRQHVCAILSNGQVVCASEGNLAAAAVNLLSTEQAVKLSTFLGHTCALLADGQVKCWGDNSRGQLNLNLNGKRAIDVAAGGSHTCVLLEEGQVQCVGNNDSGQTQVNLLGRLATKISAGLEHTCAILDNGQLSCWGLSNHPTWPVNLNVGPKIAKDISARSNDHTCVLFTDGDVRCFGNPSSPALLSGSYYTVRNIDTGLNHTCLTFLNGQIGCYGASTCIANLDVHAAHQQDITNKEGLAVSVSENYACALLNGGLLSCSAYQNSCNPSLAFVGSFLQTKVAAMTLAYQPILDFGCQDNTSCPNGTCIHSLCEPKALDGGLCDLGDDEDCLEPGVCLNGICQQLSCALASRPALPLYAHYVDNSTVYKRTEPYWQVSCDVGYTSKDPADPLSSSVKCVRTSQSTVVWSGTVSGGCAGAIGHPCPCGDLNSVNRCALNLACLAQADGSSICGLPQPLGGSCKNHQECDLLNNIKCSINDCKAWQFGTCGGSNAGCGFTAAGELLSAEAANHQCANSFTCVTNICMPLPSLTSGICDDNLDCPAGIACSVTGGISIYGGNCGGSGAVCTADSQCNNSANLYCLSSTQTCGFPAPVGGACQKNTDCLGNNCDLTTKTCVGAGGEGISCINANPNACSAGLACIPYIVRTPNGPHYCSVPKIGGYCDGVNDCPWGVDCGYGICGGIRAFCTTNDTCDANQDLYCMPNKLDPYHRLSCSPPVAAGEYCNDNQDCIYKNCSEPNPTLSTGVCGLEGLSCPASGINSACITGTVCIPDGLTSTGHICKAPSLSLNSYCDDAADCVVNGVTYDCLPEVGVSNPRNICSQKCVYANAQALPKYANYTTGGIIVPATISSLAAGTVLQVVCNAATSSYTGYESTLAGSLTCGNDGNWQGTITGTCLAKLGGYCENNNECAGYMEGTTTCVNHKCITKALGSTCEADDDCLRHQVCIPTTSKSICLGDAGFVGCASNADCASNICKNGICYLDTTNISILVGSADLTCALLKDGPYGSNKVGCFGGNNDYMNAPEADEAALRAGMIIDFGPVPIINLVSYGNWGYLKAYLFVLHLDGTVSYKKLRHDDYYYYKSDGEQMVEQLVDGQKATWIFAFDKIVCAVLSDKRVRCCSVALDDDNCVDLKMPPGKTPKAVVQASNYRCILFTDQTVQCTEVDGHSLPDWTSYMPKENVLNIANNGDNFCEFLSNGQIACFGYIGSLNNANFGTNKVKKIVYGDTFACVLWNTQKISCFGGWSDFDGNVLGSPTTRCPLLKDQTYLQAVDIVAGNQHFCVLRSNGIIDCCGRYCPEEAGPLCEAAAGINPTGPCHSPCNVPSIISGNIQMPD